MGAVGGTGTVPALDLFLTWALRGMRVSLFREFRNSTCYDGLLVSLQSAELHVKVAAVDARRHRILVIVWAAARGAARRVLQSAECRM